MLKVETQTFGAVKPLYGPKGEQASPGRKGLCITSTQMPCSTQREVAARLLSMLPETLPQELREGLKGEGGSEGLDGMALAYSVLRRLLSNAEGVKFISEAFGRHASIEVSPGVFEGLTPSVVDDAFGADFSIYLEWLAWSLMFNFHDVLNLLPDWGKGLAPTVREAVGKAIQNEER